MSNAILNTLHKSFLLITTVTGLIIHYYWLQFTSDKTKAQKVAVTCEGQTAEIPQTILSTHVHKKQKYTDKQETMKSH